MYYGGYCTICWHRSTTVPDMIKPSVSQENSLTRKQSHQKTVSPENTCPRTPHRSSLLSLQLYTGCTAVVAVQPVAVRYLPRLTSRGWLHLQYGPRRRAHSMCVQLCTVYAGHVQSYASSQNPSRRRAPPPRRLHSTSTAAKRHYYYYVTHSQHELQQLSVTLFGRVFA
jgi:hypothetical protein